MIAAFNSDLPYNRFVLEQIAADQLGLDEHAPALAGLGFLTVGMQYRNRNDLIDDQIDVVTRGLMGLTVSCARCHDHKFDAIPTKDYYALYACLANSLPPETLPIVGGVPDSPETTEYRQKLQELQHRYDEMARDQIEIMRGRFHMQVGLYLREIAGGATEQDLSTQFLSYRTDDLRPLITNRWLTYLGALGDSDPVFGPWHQLSRLEPGSFGSKASELIASLATQTADAGVGGIAFPKNSLNRCLRSPMRTEAYLQRFTKNGYSPWGKRRKKVCLRRALFRMRMRSMSVSTVRCIASCVGTCMA